MRKFVDLHVLPRVEDEKSCRQTAELLRIAGYSIVGLTVPTGLLRERTSFLRRIFEEAGIETALRIDLSSGSRVELLRLLRRFRNFYDIIGVKCNNPSVATVACRDRRVDVVFFDPRNRKVRFNHPLANLLRGAFEFNLLSTLLKETDSGIFSTITKQTAIAREHKVKVVLSSGSTTPGMVRSPSQLAALGSTLGLTEEQSTEGVSSTPLSIVTRNSSLRSSEYIEEGVRVVLPKTR